MPITSVLVGDAWRLLGLCLTGCSRVIVLCLAGGALMVDAAEPQALRDIAARSFPKGNVAIGVAAHGKSAESDSALRAIVEREFDHVTPANDFKQSVVYPRPGEPWRWSVGDRWVERASQQSQQLRIHAPIGPQVSDWMKADERSVSEIGDMLTAWIPALCERYAQKKEVRWIDVVNETIDAGGRWMGAKPGVGLADNPWLEMGLTTSGGHEVPVYVLRAFELASRHCGSLKLIVNQHVITPPAVERMKELVLAVRAKGLRVDGIGWQAHVDVGWEQRPGRMRWLTDLIDWAHANKLEFHITENNVYVPEGETVLDERAQAKTFAAILNALLERRDRGFVAWTLWHARDDQTDNKTRLGCLWNNANQPKPAYFAVRDLLSNPPVALGPPPVPSR